ncbi:WYL domain-containing protein [Chryseolinea sp. T2]|uniref:phytanoyl-CoA dioxygenase family protein n=1 Tax=Chryseolinea sp. T2 TaxID=3129255 RepID=UPI0030769DCB
MPVNRNALIRYRTIDNCLRNRLRRWTLEDLIDACSDALYEYEGIDKGVSRRSIQMDIQMMRSEKLGYNAPIIVLEKKYYTYDDPDYSITNIPLTDQDLGKLTEVVEILRQFKGFSHFQELSGMVQRLENKIHSAKTNQEPVIDFEKNDSLKGLEHIDTLYQAIVNKRTVRLCYQSFKARMPNVFDFHPYYLKEYRNRWFVIGIQQKSAPIMNLALDRIISIEDCPARFIPRDDFNLSIYLNDVIGVSVNRDGQKETVLFHADRETAPYILTKPLHQSQEVVEANSHGTTFSICVQLNFELEREILGFGDRVKVIAPDKLKRRIKDILQQAIEQYQFEFNSATLSHHVQKLLYKGFSIISYVFTKREVNGMKSAIDAYLKIAGKNEQAHSIRGLIQKVPQLKQLVFNVNLLKILDNIDPKLFLTKVLYFDKTQESNWYVTWHQDTVINVKGRVQAEGFTGWTKKEDATGVIPPDEYLSHMITVRIHLDDADEDNGALKVLPGSHKKRLTNDEISLITQNSISHICEVKAGGIQLMKPLILHASSKAVNQKHRRVIHLEFSPRDLPGKMEWAEREELHFPG